MIHIQPLGPADEEAIDFLQAELAAIFGSAVLSPPLDLDAGSV
jgi:hypothetical protein